MQLLQHHTNTFFHQHSWVPLCWKQSSYITWHPYIS
jgi:hypothetical protein